MDAKVEGELVKGVVKSCLYYIFMGVVLFAVSGRLDWWQAWVWLGIMVSDYLLLLLVLEPDLLVERAGIREGAKRWDIILAMLMSGLGYLVLLLVAALDKRFGWSPEAPLSMVIAGIVLAVLGCAVITWAMYSNKFFGPLVRIQKDRGHAVCSSGPYSFVRHPGYLGAALTFIGTPLILGTLWAFVPAVLILIDIIVRTALEDRTLQQELEGYKAYTQKVKYRLLPGLW